ncbi:hypothetical protein SCHPADRAFT_1000469 [Schizopora paradoxa]|uniref:BTB domain-containing protein n=1 Tax=Schizopora paradoxa TaxID=27342 RepID=A0A0H2RB87_9AGAM|nr:hypothetical protein SCHPADRAFT_1000469 [Schizopora paradoxa]
MEQLPKPHAILWFPDGSVILKTDSYLFRVHKSILSRESSVFKDMFAFPVNEDDRANEYDGLPVVPLLGDDEKDVIQLLRMLYKPTFGALKLSLLRMPCVVGLFKLSNKYHFSGVDAAFQKELKVVFPQSRAAFGKPQGASVRRSLFTHDNLLPLLPVVQATGKTKLFPSLLYCCSQYSINAILAEDLPPETKELLLAGREKVKLSIHDAFAHQVDYHHLGMGVCKRNPRCRTSACFAEFDTKCQTQIESKPGHGEEFFTMKEFDEVQTSTPPCDDCKEGVKKILSAVRDQVWDLLPEIFELNM